MAPTLRSFGDPFSGSRMQGKSAGHCGDPRVGRYAPLGRCSSMREAYAPLGFRAQYIVDAAIAGPARVRKRIGNMHRLVSESSPSRAPHCRPQHASRASI